MPYMPDKYRGTGQYDDVRAMLAETARIGKVVEYMPRITTIMGLDEPSEHMAAELGQMLGEIAEDEHLAGRPLLAAVAINKDNRPGGGFFTLAQALGLFDGRDRDGYWSEELKAVYREWEH